MPFELRGSSTPPTFQNALSTSGTPDSYRDHLGKPQPTLAGCEQVISGSPTNRSFVGDLPTPRFHQPLRGNPTATGGCLCRGGLPLCINRSIFNARFPRLVRRAALSQPHLPDDLSCARIRIVVTVFNYSTARPDIDPRADINAVPVWIEWKKPTVSEPDGPARLGVPVSERGESPPIAQSNGNFRYATYDFERVHRHADNSRQSPFDTCGRESTADLNGPRLFNTPICLDHDGNAALWILGMVVFGQPSNLDRNTRGNASPDMGDFETFTDGK